MKMIGVAQFDLTPHIFQIVSRNPSFDGRLGANIHKNGRLDNSSMGTLEFAAAGAAFSLQQLEHAASPIYEVSDVSSAWSSFSSVFIPNS